MSLKYFQILLQQRKLVTKARSGLLSFSACQACFLSANIWQPPPVQPSARSTVISLSFHMFKGQFIFHLRWGILIFLRAVRCWWQAPILKYRSITSYCCQIDCPSRLNSINMSFIANQSDKSYISKPSKNN